ncbi:serine/threonine-protein kinase [Stenotrophomonas aracearum]|jgi:serine/threonine-protein kinase|uniref:Serine/threonine-protein kinase n=1 Tax=Stenotrophomonas aracearum TaxID=3003272 RepID=A0ABY9YDB0_9GAMM|nr:serine/threonine-protein kinase [Stenotrophomonas sp. A5588]WNH48865.1 serine/threonine-protein kinase [Stenotrophomonas sp. A5588]
MDAVRWRQLSSLLDQLLEMPHDQRSARLAQLRAADATLADDLERLLAHEHESQDFMAQPLWTAAPEESRAGTHVGPYQLLRQLGEGGMGEVWLAERADGLYQRQVALKLLRSGYADPGLRQRFSREREILARLQHPHLAQLLDAGVDLQGQPYLALAYVEGEPITDYCQRLQLPLERRLQLMLQVCAVVSHAHANLIVHRDLKPSNILVTAEGEVKLLDFGIAKLLAGDELPANAAHPPTEARAFTLHYAAPEQVRGEPVTTLTDVYSLGVVLFEVITGRKPYRLRRHSDAEWERSILEVDAPRASSMLLRGDGSDTGVMPATRRLARRLRGDLDTVLLKALQKDPAERYASVEALAQDLQRFLDGRPIQARPQRSLYRLRKYLGRHRWGVALALVAVLALVALAALALWQMQQARREIARAQAMQDFTIGLFDRAASVRHGSFDVRQLLATGQQRGEAELADQPLPLADLEGVIGRLRIGMGDYALALETLDRQRALLERVKDVPPGLQLEAVTQRGRALRMLGRSRECVAHLLPMQTLAEEQRQALPSLVAEFHAQLGRCQQLLGYRDEARDAFQLALTLRRDGIHDATGTAESLADLAALDYDDGNAPAALAGYRQALQLLQNRSTDRHPQLVTLRRHLGETLAAQGDLDGAEQALRAAWADAVALYGADHPETLSIRRLRATLALQQGELAEAGQALQDVHRLTRKALGERHRDTGLTWHALGRLALERGDSAGAVDAFARAVAIWRQPDCIGLLPQGLYDYGSALAETGRWQDALAALHEGRQWQAAQRGDDDPDVQRADRRMAEIIGEHVDPWQAGDRLATLMRQSARGGPDARLQQQAVQLAWGRNLVRMDQPVEAQRVLQPLTLGDATDPRSLQLRWLARATLAQLDCALAPVRGRQALLRLQGEVRQQRPQGGYVPRQIDQALQACQPERQSRATAAN